jgi:hypothetical protein
MKWFEGEALPPSSIMSLIKASLEFLQDNMKPQEVRRIKV